MRIRLIFTGAFLLIPLLAFGQRPTRLPSTTGCYRQAITPISAIPTLHTDMPLDCMLGYIYFDSLCRANFGLDNWNTIDSLVHSIDSWDTLHVFMRFKYRMEEYDADLFREFIQAGAYDTNYRQGPGGFENLLYQLMNQNNTLGNHSKEIYLTEVPVILHIKVLDTSASYDSVDRLSTSTRRCVSAEIIDTIKGMHLRPGDCGLYHTGKQKSPLDYGCINFDYSPMAAKAMGMGDVIHSPIRDSTGQILCDSCYGTSALIPGHEYIVFLADNFLDYNGTTSFYEYVPQNAFNSEGGIFPINGLGNVVSTDNYFGYGNSVPLATFESDLKADINSIISH